MSEIKQFDKIKLKNYIPDEIEKYYNSRLKSINTQLSISEDNRDKRRERTIITRHKLLEKLLSDKDDTLKKAWISIGNIIKKDKQLQSDSDVCSIYIMRLMDSILDIPISYDRDKKIPRPTEARKDITKTSGLIDKIYKLITKNDIYKHSLDFGLKEILRFAYANETDSVKKDLINYLTSYPINQDYSTMSEILVAFKEIIKAQTPSIYLRLIGGTPNRKYKGNPAKIRYYCLQLSQTMYTNLRFHLDTHVASFAQVMLNLKDALDPDSIRKNRGNSSKDILSKTDNKKQVVLEYKYGTDPEEVIEQYKKLNPNDTNVDFILITNYSCSSTNNEK